MSSGFSTFSIASDIYNVLNALKSNKKIFVYGHSYGTLVINQLMQMKPSLVSAVVLDSVYLPQGNDKNRTIFYELDENINSAGISVLRECQSNSYCSKDTLGTGPSGHFLDESVEHYVEKVFERVFSNFTCHEITENHGVEFWKKFMSELLMSHYGREAVPALLFRLDRCDEYDLPVLHRIIQLYDERNAIPTFTPQSSAMMKRHLIYSDLWGTKGNIPSMNQLKRKYELNYFAKGVYEYASIFKQWPTIQVGPYFNKTFSGDYSVLILNSRIDPITPAKYAQEMSNLIQSTHKYTYIIPNAHHWVIMNSPISSANETVSNCGMEIFLSFLSNPTVAPGSSCLDSLSKISFRGEVESNQKYFGVSDLYNGVYEDIRDRQVVDLYFFISLYSATSVILLVVIGLLTYYTFQLKAKEKEKEQDEEDEDLEYLEQE
jgi:pimeloyl-ACP methyl ester carboxylesterase